MASIVSSCKLSVRLASSRIKLHPCRRGFRSSSKCLAGYTLPMPAMSPTMTQGNIARWVVREGDSFSTGDVLLEIETDKTQIEVEAQDDGILAKIIAEDGTKDIKVGSRIAILAEAGDDISNIEGLKRDVSCGESLSQKDSQVESHADPAPRSAPPAPGKNEETSGTTQNPKYPLYPSIHYLLHQSGLSVEEAYKIPSSGPNGRLLKGDVLSYLGKIAESYSGEQSQRIQRLTHLDLSNIVKKPEQASASHPESSQKESSNLSEESNRHESKDFEPVTEITLPISLTAVLNCQQQVKDTIGVHLPILTFISRASELANEGLPKSKSARPTKNELFDSILGLESSTSAQFSQGSFWPSLKTDVDLTCGDESAYPRAKEPKQDIYDILTGTTKAKPRRRDIVPDPEVTSSKTASSPEVNLFSVEAGVGEEGRARLFLERVKTMLEVEPGRLVL